MKTPKITPLLLSPTQTMFPVGLTPQTGMPPIYHSRSRELNYDVLIHVAAFMPNPFGPQALFASRPEHHW